MDDNLIRRVQDLPPELFNQILSNTFDMSSETIGSNVKTVLITTAYKYPPILQVNHAYRQHVAKQYFSELTFIISGNDQFRSFVRRLDKVFLAHEPAFLILGSGYPSVFGRQAMVQMVRDYNPAYFPTWCSVQQSDYMDMSTDVEGGAKLGFVIKARKWD